jgi:hypothetical protein
VVEEERLQSRGGVERNLNPGPQQIEPHFCRSNRRRGASFRWGFVGVLRLMITQLQALLPISVQVATRKK